MNEVPEPLLSIRIIVRAVGWHVECSLSQECLGVGWHVAEVVHHHEHLDHGAKRIEESQLDSASLGDPVSLLAKIDVALQIIIELHNILKIFCSSLPNKEKHSLSFRRECRRRQ